VNERRKALSRPRKTDIEGVDVTCWDRLFQVWAAVTGKAGSLTVDSCVRRTFTDSEEADRRCLWTLKSACQMSDFKAKMHQIRFPLALRPRSRWGSLYRPPDRQTVFKGTYF